MVLVTSSLPNSNNNTIRKVTRGRRHHGRGSVAASFNDADGPQTDARFSEPNGVAVDADGNIYVGDSLDDTVRKIDTSGNVTTLAGASESAREKERERRRSSFGLRLGRRCEQECLCGGLDQRNDPED